MAELILVVIASESEAIQVLRKSWIASSLSLSQ
jgi:hypothetical protein